MTYGNRVSRSSTNTWFLFLSTPTWNSRYATKSDVNMLLCVAYLSFQVILALVVDSPIFVVVLLTPVLLWFIASSSN